MHLNDGLEGVDAHAVEDRIAQDAGVVDHAIELAKTVDRGLDDLAGRNGFRDGLEIRNRGAAAIVDHDLGALGGAQQRDFATDAAPGAGDDDDFILQRFCIGHCGLPWGLTRPDQRWLVKMIVPDAANMPPTPWQTEILAPGTCAGAMPRICRTLSCSAYMPYIPECM